MDGIASAAWVVDGFVPVAADSMVGGVLCDIDEFGGSGVGLACGLVDTEELADDVLRAVGGVVVHDEDVERVGGCYLLREGARDGIADGASAVLAGDNDAGSNGVSVRILDFYGMEVGGGDESVDGAQMLGYGLLHLYLHGAVAWVHIVEEFLAGLAVVVLYFIVEVFGDVYERRLRALGGFQTEVVEPCVLVVSSHARCCLAEGVGVPKHDGAEVKIIAEGAELVVNNGCFDGQVAIRCPLEMVGIDHLRMGHLQDLHHALLRAIDPLDVGLGDEERIGRFSLGSDVADKVG